MNTEIVPSSLISSRARFLRTGGAALDEAADGETVIAAVDQLALQLDLVRPVELLQAAIEASRDSRRCRTRRLRSVGVMVATLYGCSVARSRFLRRNSTRSMPRSSRDHVEQPLAEEIGLEPARAAIGADRRLVGHPERRIDRHVRNAIRPAHELRRCCARRPRRWCACRRPCRHARARAGRGWCRRARRRSRCRTRPRARGSSPSGFRAGPRSISPGG